MQTDKELLELAATALQAAGDPSFANFDVLEDGSGVCLELGCRRGAITSYWKPLADDGDALRLAVKLLIWPMPGAHCGEARVSYDDFRDEIFTEWHRENNNDPYAAARRAIVRAAAEIGAQSTPQPADQP